MNTASGKFISLAFCLLVFTAYSNQEQEIDDASVNNYPSSSNVSKGASAVVQENIQRRPFFGDLHVHSSWSLDSFVSFNPISPEQSYRFARGEEVTLAGGRRLQLDQPLDFTAVTDHAEYLGELSLCLDKEGTQYDLPLCQDIRNVKREKKLVNKVFRNVLIRDSISQAPKRESALCGKNDIDCTEHIRDMWQKLIQVADAYYSPGEFTTFVAYEWSKNTSGNNLHRNVIFRNNHVPSLPISYFEAPTPSLLWRQLMDSCQAPCDVLAIPHNSNQSKGRQFPATMSQADARLRSELEPLVEIIQGKGGSECQVGVGTIDEYCDFELLERRPVCAVESDDIVTDCVRVCQNEDESGACIQKNIYFRNALKDGLRLEKSLKVNPYKFGVIGSTDTHNGTPGATDESNYKGLFGADDATPELRAKLPEIKKFNAARFYGASGLAGVWAEENTRDSIFNALQRKETFATSGTRIVLRFFGGWDFESGMEEEAELVSRGYQDGVAMGDDLPPFAGKPAPGFLLWAMKAMDGAPLQKIQIIKGWHKDGVSHEATYDAVCSDGLKPDPKTHRCLHNGASVNLETCELSDDRGALELSGYWQDQSFDPAHSAFYYIRVLENPSCRWSTWDAIREGKPLFKDVSPVIQERAWSSAIWYKPGKY